MTIIMKNGHIVSLLLVLLVSFAPYLTSGLSIVIAGGTGTIGRELSSILHNQNTGHKINILTRNKFLASAPARVTGEFGWLGESFLEVHDSVALRDWDGGDLLDIVGCDWMGWQDDALNDAISFIESFIILPAKPTPLLKKIVVDLTIYELRRKNELLCDSDKELKKENEAYLSKMSNGRLKTEVTATSTASVDEKSSDFAFSHRHRKRIRRNPD